MLQFHPFWMISSELKAEFRRATRGIDENAVARRLSLVFIDSLRGIAAFRKTNRRFQKNLRFLLKNHRFRGKTTLSIERSSFSEKSLE